MKKTFNILEIFFILSLAYFTFRITKSNEYSLLPLFFSLALSALYFLSIGKEKLIPLFSLLSYSILLSIYLAVDKMTNGSLESFAVDGLIIILSTTTDEIFATIENIPFRKIYIAILGIIITILFFITEFKENKIITKKSVGSLILATSMILTPNFFISKTIKNILNSQNSIEEYKLAEKQKNIFRWGAYDTKKSPKSLSIIILGETTRGKNSSCNGYFRETTPNIEQSGSISFSNAISLGKHTVAATPYILTRKDLSFNGVFNETSIFSAYKEAGYKTYYISYLPEHHVGDNPINSITSEADTYIRRTSKYDDGAVNIINSLMQKNENRQLIILKIVGSHYNFYTWYPESFDFFKPSYKTIKFNSPTIKEKDILINTYDNSLRFTDHVVGKIFDLIKNKNYDITLSFISDHGIALFDDNKNWGVMEQKGNYDILYFYWANKIASERLGNKLSILESNKDKPIDASYFLDTQFEFDGISVDKTKGKSLFQPISKHNQRFVMTSSGIKDFESLP